VALTGFCWTDLGKREMNLEGELLMVLAVAGPLALVLALAILHFYRRSIQREMRNATAGASPVGSEGVARRAPLAALKYAGERQRQLVVIAAYAAALGLLCLWVGLGTHSVATGIGGIELPAFLNPAVFWAIAAAPSAYLLLFANRRVRAVGPVVLAFAGLAVGGGVLILGLLGTAPGLRAAAAILSATGLDAKSLLFAAALVGVAIGVPLGWMAVQALARAYDAQRLSTHGLVTDTIWLVQSFTVAHRLPPKTDIGERLGWEPLQPTS
jgi:hypothetical protein